MQRNIYLYLLLIIMTACLSSCGQLYSSANNFVYMRQGSSSAKIEDAFAAMNFDSFPTFEFEFENQRYKCLVYPVVNCLSKETEDVPRDRALENSNNYPNKAMRPPENMPQPQQSRTKTLYLTDPLFVITLNKKFVLWSYLYELKSSPLNKTNQLGLAIEDAYRNYLRSKGVDYDEN